MSMEMVLAEAVIDSGDTAWVLISAGLVLFMVPGLAFFYAGLVRGSSALVMLQQNLVPLGLVSINLGRVRIQLRVQWRLGFRLPR